MLNLRLFSFTTLAGIMGIFGVSVHADNITILATFAGSGSDSAGADNTVAAQGVFKYDSTTNQLLVAVTNDTAASQMLSTHDLLTAVGFDLTGVTLDNAGVGVADTTSDASASGIEADVGYPNGGTTVVTKLNGGAVENLGAGWGAAEINPSTEFGDNYVATVAAAFGISNALVNSDLLDTTAYGIIPAIANVQQQDSFNTHPDFTFGTLNLAFDIATGVPSSNEISNVQFFFGQWGGIDQGTYTAGDFNGYASGSPAPVPEPGSLGLMALGGMVLLAKRRKKPRALSHNSSRPQSR
jgi:PEP-CTERM motif